MAILYVMVGAPGSGKTTFIQNHMNKETDKHVSRDAIRFSLLNENDEYFSKETQVFRNYINEINKALNEGYNVFADATHLNESSRNKLLKNIRVKPSSTECIYVRTPLERALELNELRKDTRAYVPRGQIRRMFNSMTKPSFEEGFDRIYIIEEGNPIEVLERG